MKKRQTYINETVKDFKKDNTKKLLSNLEMTKQQKEIIKNEKHENAIGRRDSWLDEYDDDEYDYNYCYDEYSWLNKPFNQSVSKKEEVKEPEIKVKWCDKAILEYGKARLMYDGEFAFVVAFEVEDGLIKIKDIELIKEDKQTSVFVEVDTEKYTDSLKKLLVKYDDDNTKFAHGHSHCFMSTVPSTTDTDTALELSIKWNVNELTMFIINDKFETTCLYTSKHSIMGYSLNSKLLQHE